MTVSTFATKYNNCKRLSDKENLVRSIIKRPYVTYIEKVSMIQSLLGASFNEKNGLKIPDELCIHINFHILILSLYTDLEIDKTGNDKTDGFQAYDIFQACDIWSVLKRQIGPDYAELENVKELYIKNMAAENELSVQLSNQVTRFATLINSAFKPLASIIQTAMENLSSEDRENLKNNIVKIIK